MADPNRNYKYLIPEEKAYYDIYTRLRELSDWSGFTSGQDDRRGESRMWLQNQRKAIYHAAGGENGKHWDDQNRRQRYEQLKDENLNAGNCQRLCQLPTNGGTPREKALISEREMWWLVTSVDETTRKWRQSQVDNLIVVRKGLFTLAEDDTWNKAERPLRYKNLCIATKYGANFKAWEATHNPQTGASKPPSKPPPGGVKSSRERCIEHARTFIGVTEKPANSNRGNPQPSGWQKRVYGADGVPWCACFSTCMAWDVGVKGASSAGVAIIMDMAKRGQGMFRGWTTDPRQARRGDMLVIGCGSCHIGIVAETPGGSTNIKTIEGNTSPGSSGSQYNGGCVANRTRSRGEWVGFALVDFPG